MNKRFVLVCIIIFSLLVIISSFAEEKIELSEPGFDNEKVESTLSKPASKEKSVNAELVESNYANGTTNAELVESNYADGTTNAELVESNYTYGTTNAELVESSEENISYAEYIDTLATAKNISVEEAILFDKEQNINIKEIANDNGFGNRDVGTTYRNVIYKYNYQGNSNYKVELRATLKLYGEYIYYQINGVQQLYSVGTSGMYNWSWVEYSSWYDAVFPSKSVVLSADGMFIIDVSIGGSDKIKKFFGFNIGMNLQYRSEIMTLRETYSLY